MATDYDYYYYYYYYYDYYYHHYYCNLFNYFDTMRLHIHT